MMSVIANSLLKEVFFNKNISNTEEILFALDELLFDALNKNNAEEIRYDGMDIALCSVDKQTNVLEFSGAMRPAFIIQNGALTEIRGSKFPLGFHHCEKSFERVSMQLRPGDMIYLSSDGYGDQFGGDRNKKMNRKAFKELLLSVADMSGEEQEAFLEYAHKNWKQGEGQTDDILVIGIRV
jgi:serine phosphatase RsbU (regulator of sigma subunit)